MKSDFLDQSVPADLLYVRYSAAERHDRLASAANQRRLRRWFRP